MSNKSNYYIAVELGTSNTLIAIGESKKDARLKIIYIGHIISCGIKKSQITSLNDVCRSINSLIKDLSQDTDIEAKYVTLVINGQHIHSKTEHGTITIESGKVTREDIENVYEDAIHKPLAQDLEILDIIPQHYTLDRVSDCENPLGLSGRLLLQDVLRIYASKARVNDAKSALSQARIEIEETLPSILCSANASLTESDRKNGVIIIDLGGGSTGFAVYCDRILMYLNVIGVGGEHITNDIAYAFQTTTQNAEKLKREYANAILGVSDDNAPIKIGSDTPLLQNTSVSPRQLDTVVNARLKELFTIIREEIEDKNLLHVLRNGIVLVGGGSAMNGIEELASREFGGLPVRLGTPENVDFATEYLQGKKAINKQTITSLAGALLRAQAIEQENEKENFSFAKIFERFWS